MLFRESPLNSIWEGSGNVICLDILRSRERDGAGRAALEQELDAAKGADSAYDAALDAHTHRWGRTIPEAEARWFAESAATLLTASVLIRSGVPEVADAYAATRLGGPRGRTAGAMAEREAGAVLARLG